MLAGTAAAKIAQTARPSQKVLGSGTVSAGSPSLSSLRCLEPAAALAVLQCMSDLGLLHERSFPALRVDPGSTTAFHLQ